MFVCLPPAVQDVGDFVSSLEHKQRFLTRTVAVCQSYNGSQWDSGLWEKKKTYTDKTKLNPVARDDTHWGLKTQKYQSVQETEQYLYRFFTSDAPHCPTVLSAFTTDGV